VVQSFEGGDDALRVRLLRRVGEPTSVILSDPVGPLGERSKERARERLVGDQAANLVRDSPYRDALWDVPFVKAGLEEGTVLVDRRAETPEPRHDALVFGDARARLDLEGLGSREMNPFHLVDGRPEAVRHSELEGKRVETERHAALGGFEHLPVEPVTSSLSRRQRTSVDRP